MDSITSSEVVKPEGGTDGVIVTLPPMVEKGHRIGVVGEERGSISKDKSNGWAPLLHGTKWGFSVSSLDVRRMYSAVATTGCKLAAHPYRVKL